MSPALADAVWLRATREAGADNNPQAEVKTKSATTS